MKPNENDASTTPCYQCKHWVPGLPYECHAPGYDAMTDEQLRDFDDPVKPCPLFNKRVEKQQ
jgi:hypothetical protein